MKIKISENIKNLRKAYSLTQEQLAEMLGVTVGAVYKWEAGLSMPEIRLIMEIADFFEVSVDTLLGYEQQNGNVENRIQRIRQCIVEKDYEAGASEVEKTLKKYSNNFNVTYAGAMLYRMKFLEEKCEESMIKSNQLFEKAISLLYQNTEKSINEVIIRNHMASNYLVAGDTEKGLELLKQNNICNINSGQIGLIYTTELRMPEEAERYLQSSLSEIINKTIYTVVGIAYGHALKGDETCISEALWLMHYFDSLKENADEISFLDKLKAILLAQCAVWEFSFGHKDIANVHIKAAYLLAQKFDSSPVYTVHNTLFLKEMEKEASYADGIGKTAVEAVENFVFEKKTGSEAQTQMEVRWEELKSGDSESK